MYAISKKRVFFTNIQYILTQNCKKSVCNKCTCYKYFKKAQKGVQKELNWKNKVINGAQIKWVGECPGVQNHTRFWARKKGFGVAKWGLGSWEIHAWQTLNMAITLHVHT